MTLRYRTVPDHKSQANFVEIERQLNKITNRSVLSGARDDPEGALHTLILLLQAKGVLGGRDDRVMTDDNQDLSARLDAVDAEAVIQRVSALVAGAGSEVERALYAAGYDFERETRGLIPAARSRDFVVGAFIGVELAKGPGGLTMVGSRRRDELPHPAVRTRTPAPSSPHRRRA